MSELKEILGINEYLELIKEDTYLSLGYANLALYIDMLERSYDKVLKLLGKDEDELFLGDDDEA